MAYKFGEPTITFGNANVTFGGEVTVKRTSFRFMPLYSMQAWGKFYGPWPHGCFYNYGPYVAGYAIYQRRHTPYGIMCIKERYYSPGNRHHPNIVTGQSRFRDGVKAWQNLTLQDKAVYNHYRYPSHMSGFNRFMRYYLMKRFYKYHN